MEAHKIFKQLVETMIYLQNVKSLGQASIIHRDLKPENVLLSFDDVNMTSVKFTKLIDFGFAIYLNKNIRD